MIILSRYVIIKNIHKFKPIKKNKIRALIVGHSYKHDEVVEKLKRIDSGYTIVEYISSDLINDNISVDVIREKVCDYINFAEKNAVNEIFLIDFPVNNIDWNDLIHFAERKFIRLKLIPNYHSILLSNPRIKFENGLPIISFRNDPLEKIENRILKRLFDIVFSIFVFIFFLSWLFPIIIIIIKITSEGPIFFIQKRSGKNRTVFKCYKFRTMYVNSICDEIAANKNDTRITSFGKFLRRSNLDELPQFYNVLKGEMSVIGPRPHMLKHTEDFGKVINHYNVRHFLNPGISGWAQVNGYRGDLSGNKMQKRVEFDLWYLENWSFLLDVRIILKTLWISLKGDNNVQ
jgi:exopolysaccharide biosynthesis polyprenyl glycosylphosphotransferase